MACIGAHLIRQDTIRVYLERKDKIRAILAQVCDVNSGVYLRVQPKEVVWIIDTDTDMIVESNTEWFTE